MRMRALRFDIPSRNRTHPNQPPRAADFELAFAGDVDGRAVIDDPSCSLYCLDPAGRRAIFVQTPPDVDLHYEVFLYQAQHRHATRVLTLSYDDFTRAAHDRGAPSENIVFLYSVGRCGSTLLSRAFHHFDDVLSLSEPDAPMQLLAATSDPTSEASSLLESTVRLLCKPGGRKRPSHYVLKLRAEGTKLATTLHRLFPSSRALFLYRNAVDVVRSYIRAFHPLPAGYLGYHDDPIRFFTEFWLSHVNQYRAAHEQGVPIRAYRYEDMLREPHAMLSEIARACGTPLTGLEQAMSAFAEDSQEGSNLARQNVDDKRAFDLGTREQLTARVRAALAKHADHPSLHDPDVILPGTWLPGHPPPPNRNE